MPLLKNETVDQLIDAGAFNHAKEHEDMFGQSSLVKALDKWTRQLTLSRQFYLGFTGVLVVLLLFDAVAHGQPKIIDKQASAQPKTTEKDTSEAPGFFIPVSQAKDCAYDHVRQRLYVTTLKQLVVVDVKERKVLESIDLLGNVQGMDIAPQAKFLAIAPIGGQYVYKLGLGHASQDQPG